MACMIPESIPPLIGTPGDRGFHNFLKSVSRNRDDVHVWYDVEVRNRQIDFGLLIHEAGESRFRKGDAGTVALLRFLCDSRRASFQPPPVTRSNLEALYDRVFASRKIIVTPPEATKSVARKIGEIELDAAQARYARELPDGPRLIKWMAGSRKSIILSQRAIFKANEATPARVLFTCYNLSLANHLRDRVNIDLPADRRDKVSVLPFFDLCVYILGEPIRDTGDSAYFKAVIERATTAATVLPDDRKFDTLLIDEGQDFSADMGRIALSMLRGGSRDEMAAIDESQDLYGWGGNPAGGHRLYRPYAAERLSCTREIFGFAHKISGRLEPPPFDAETDILLDVPLGKRSGPEQSGTTFDEAEQLIERQFGTVDRLIKVDGIPPAENSILYTSRFLPKSEGDY